MKHQNYELKKAHPLDVAHLLEEALEWVMKSINFTEKVNISINIEVEV